MASIRFNGVDGTTHKWGIIETSGHKLTENVFQATSRDLLTHAMHQVDAAWRQIVMHIHDKVIIDKPASGASATEIMALMTKLPTWAGVLPSTLTATNVAST